MKRTEKKRKQKKAVLICTLATAAVIVGGMTFAWYTAKDEVTNRFTANANFGASIVEEFAPPTDWQPGATVEKKASVVNTGTVDAFVRAWLTGEMRVVAPVEGDAYSSASLEYKADPRINATTNVARMGLVETASDAKTYYKVLDTTANPNPTSTGVALSEVQAIQAGGYLAYASAGASWTFTDPAGESKTGSVASGSDFAACSAGWEIDADTFVPKATGLYLFRRNMDIKDNDNDKNIEYTGYYYVKNGSGDDGTYYALQALNGNGAASNASSDITVVKGTAPTTGKLQDTDLSGIKLYKAEAQIYSDIDNDATNNLKWVTITGATADLDADTKTKAGITDASNLLKVSNVENGGIIAYVLLDNIGTDAEQWTILGNNEKSTFYYTNDLESGDTTTNFVKNVTLSDKLTQNDFLTFDFDLNVNMDSVQVTTDTDGKELTTSAKAAFSDANGSAPTKIADADVAAEYNNSSDKNEITKVTWTASNP